MIVLQLIKREPSGKMFVSRWEFVTKEIAATIKQIPGVTVVVEEKDLPADFFESHKYYFYEDGKIRYSTV